MIVGTGIDILKVSRIKPEHSRRILSDIEIKVFDSFPLEQRKLEYLAGRFALKEAIIKAIGNTQYKIGMRDITIINDETGMPKLISPSFPDLHFSISLSHEHDYAAGICIIENV
ncbi:MAG: holo-ACP synthase [Bacilli bacterium]|nr:holo-ACP synthase [Bacilli bacterium]